MFNLLLSWQKVTVTRLSSYALVSVIKSIIVHLLPKLSVENLDTARKQYVYTFQKKHACLIDMYSEEDVCWKAIYSLAQELSFGHWSYQCRNAPPRFQPTPMQNKNNRLQCHHLCESTQTSHKNVC